MSNFIYLVLVIVFIIVATTRLKIHPFLTLLVAVNITIDSKTVVHLRV